MKVVVPHFSIKGFYFSSLALADDSPPTVFSAHIYSLSRALWLILKKNFQCLRPFYITVASQNPERVRPFKAKSFRKWILSSSEEA